MEDIAKLMGSWEAQSSKSFIPTVVISLLVLTQAVLYSTTYAVYSSIRVGKKDGEREGRYGRNTHTS